MYDRYVGSACVRAWVCVCVCVCVCWVGVGVIMGVCTCLVRMDHDKIICDEPIHNLWEQMHLDNILMNVITIIDPHTMSYDSVVCQSSEYMQCANCGTHHTRRLMARVKHQRWLMYKIVLTCCCLGASILVSYLKYFVFQWGKTKC